MKRKEIVIQQKLNVELLEDESIRLLHQRRLNERISKDCLKETNGINENWEIIKSNILTAAKEHLVRER